MIYAMIIIGGLLIAFLTLKKSGGEVYEICSDCEHLIAEGSGQRVDVYEHESSEEPHHQEIYCYSCYKEYNMKVNSAIEPRYYKSVQKWGDRVKEDGTPFYKKSK